jgi:hypothetical protein
MSTVAEATVAEELASLREIASTRGWSLREIDAVRFHLALPASDSTWLYVLVDCERYPVQPPAWRWCDAEGKNADHPCDQPRGLGFLHPSGVICAPWNRLAYKSIDSRGPHQDWILGDWRNNSYTGGCRTLAAMALRIFVELNGPRFERRRLG